MNKPVYVSLWLAALLLGTLLASAQGVAAAPPAQDSMARRDLPGPPANRLGLLSPYSLLGAGVNGENLNSNRHRTDSDLAAAELAPRGTITERLTILAQGVDEASPYHDRTWLTYYGRPGIPIMGILGEYDADELSELLKKQAREYEYANSRALSVLPAFHLVYGMATKAPGDDNSHLAYLEDDVVMDYIAKAEEENFGVILDVQIGALSPVEAISPALPYLAYEHVHLGIDPEFRDGASWAVVARRPHRLCDCRASERGAVDHSTVHAAQSH